MAQVLPALLSFRAGLHIGMRVKVLSSIDTLSREISHRHGEYHSGVGFLHFAPVEMTGAAGCVQAFEEEIEWRRCSPLCCHFERGCMSVMAANVLSSIDTLSREISRRHGEYHSGVGFLHSVETLHRVSKSAEVGL